ncbi:MAG: YceD family protein [Betaproteobacteria bacterium]
MPTEIDAFEFTRAGRSAEGCEPLASLVRLASLLAEPAGELVWRLDGWRQRDASNNEQMVARLRASATVGMRCGRCLGVVAIPIAIDRAFLLVRDEAEAAALDESEDDVDVLVASRQFSVDDLLEDESILALPPAVAHAQCQRPVGAGAAAASETEAEEERPSPFAALTSLKRNSTP